MTTPEAIPDLGAEATPAPTTGNPRIDAALTEFGSLADHPADQHHARLAALSDELAAVLEDRGAPHPPAPGLPGPR